MGGQRGQRRRRSISGGVFTCHSIYDAALFGSPRGRGPECRLVFRFAADPGFAVDVEFLFPDRYDLLDPLDRVATGVERLGPMRGSDRNPDTHLADGETSYPVMDCDSLDIPPLADLGTDLRQRLFGGRFVRLVFENENAPTARVVSHAAGERRDGPGARAGNQVAECLHVDRLLGHPELE